MRRILSLQVFYQGKCLSIARKYHLTRKSFLSNAQFSFHPYQITFHVFNVSKSGSWVSLYSLDWTTGLSTMSQRLEMGKREDGSCECQLITHWGADQWNGMDSLESWRKFLFLSGHLQDIIPNTCSNICCTHYRRILEIKAQRTCCICGMA